MLRSNFLLGLLILAFLTGSASAQARVRDEIDDFFRDVPAPTEEQRKEIDTLWRLIRIGTREERRDSRRRLVELGRMTVPFLLGELRTDNAEEARQAALVLARVGDDRVADALREIVTATKRARVPGASNRRHAAFALGELGSSQDVDLLTDMLRHLKRAEQRRANVWALARIGDDGAVPRLLEIAARDRVQETRSAAFIALGRIRDRRALKLLQSNRANGKEALRRAVTLALADFRDPEIHGLLAKQLFDRDERVVRYALVGLALYTDPRIAPLIKRSGLLLEGDDEIAALAVTALGSQTDEKSLDLLASRMKPRAKRPRRVKQALAFAFARHKGEAAAAYLAHLREDPDVDVARAALIAETLRGAMGALVLGEVAASDRADDDLRMTSMELLAHAAGDGARSKLTEVARTGAAKKKVVERARELLAILDENGARAIMRGRIQVLIDDLGGSPEWNLIRSIHAEFLDDENLDRNLDARSGGGVGPGGQPRPPDNWTHEEEDMRLWYDLYPYLDRRLTHEVP